MRINTNLSAMTALNSSSKTTALASSSMEKLSSGLKINKAGDDAAGLAISEKMRSQIRGLDQAEENTQDGISLVQTAEGATEEVGNIVQRMRELSVQSSNETNTESDRTKIVEELTQLHEEIDRIADSTQFNGKNILNGSEVLGTKIEVTADETNGNGFTVTGLEKLGLSGDIKITTVADTTNSKITVTVGTDTFELAGIAPNTAAGGVSKGEYTLTGTKGSININIEDDITAPKAETQIATSAEVDVTGSKLNLQVGANTSESEGLQVQVANIKTSSLGLNQSDIDAMTTEGEDGTTAAKKMIDNLDKALETINTSRANLGAMQNRLETTSSNLTTSNENLTAAESRIRDVDVAAEMMNLSKLNLINQAAQAMMTQAKSQPEGVMQLLR